MIFNTSIISQHFTKNIFSEKNDVIRKPSSMNFASEDKLPKKIVFSCCELKQTKKLRKSNKLSIIQKLLLGVSYYHFVEKCFTFVFVLYRIFVWGHDIS